MTQIPVRIKVRCAGCRSGFRLSQEQYHELLKQSRVGLLCPHCGKDFEYNPVATSESKEWGVRSEAKSHSPFTPLPEALPVSAFDYPPPPFAPLGVGTAVVHATPPPFAPLTGNAFAAAPAAPFPHGAPVPSGGEATKLTLNERWKKLPPWVQWTAIGILVVVMAVIIFAIPTGGGSGSPEVEKSKAVEHTPTSAEKKTVAREKVESDAPKAESRTPKSEQKRP